MEKSIDAYDADMEIMHPNRFKMVKVPLEFIPLNGDAPLYALDFGVGTGLIKKTLDSHVALPLIINYT